MLTRAELTDRLNELAEPDYAAFSSRLIPGCPPMLGVRLPALRALARELAKTPGEALALLRTDSFEERMLRGMVLGAAKLPEAERAALLTAFLPLIDNWSICDSTAVSCKFLPREADFWLPRLHALARDEREFPSRFGVVCLMDHFANSPEGRTEILAACRAAGSDGLYTKLGVAWAVSVVAVKDPAQGEAFLAESAANRVLDPYTQNKAIQKIRESRRAAPAYREKILAYRR